MNETTFKDSMVRNCRQVFATMLNIDISEASSDRAALSLHDAERVVSLIGFGGEYCGNCLVSCSKSLACRLASIMLLEEYNEASGEVMDALGEISNMIFGNVKTELEDHLGPLQLSTPTVIVGRELNMRSLANPSWMAISLKIMDDVFEARMCVSLNARNQPSQGIKLAS